jgi:hypothetical protein
LKAALLSTGTFFTLATGETVEIAASAEIAVTVYE